MVYCLQGNAITRKKKEIEIVSRSKRRLSAEVHMYEYVTFTAIATFGSSQAALFTDKVCHSLGTMGSYVE